MMQAASWLRAPVCALANETEILSAAPMAITYYLPARPPVGQSASRAEFCSLVRPPREARCWFEA